MRGDEPQTFRDVAPDTVVFPTCVGMNRYYNKNNELFNSVPHMRGDEPTDSNPFSIWIWCSPHAWG